MSAFSIGVSALQVSQKLLDLTGQNISNVVAIESGGGLANATRQQRLVAVRLFYDYLVEEGYRDANPVGRGRYSAGTRYGGRQERGLVPRLSKLPWIPTDEQWQPYI